MADPVKVKPRVDAKIMELEPVSETAKAAPVAPLRRKLRSVHGGRMCDPETGVCYDTEGAYEVATNWTRCQFDAKKLSVV